MSLYYNQFSVRPARATGRSDPRDPYPARPLRTPEHAAEYLARRDRQRRQRVRAY
jgi:hypothetical protein